MTIKEIEERSGMDRANIRFYEKEGLLRPKRQENGYRDYTEADLEMLLRIRLLRSLHISLDEIKGLMTDQQNFGALLKNQMDKLQKEQEMSSYAYEVCRELREKGTAFSELDAGRYLEELERRAEKANGGTGTALFPARRESLPGVFRPWHRYFARMTDLILYETVVLLCFSLIFRVSLLNEGNLGSILSTFLAMALMIFTEPLFLHLWGTTPGKAMLGLRLVGADGKHLTYEQGFSRVCRVAAKGMGFYIPIYTLVCCWRSYQRCAAQELLPWEEEVPAAYTMKENRWYRWTGVGAAFVLYGAALFFSSRYLLIPPNRGELTVAEFAENFNHYADYYDIDFQGRRLNGEGAWAEKDLGITRYAYPDELLRPDFVYETENGVLTGVSYVVEAESIRGWIEGGNDAMLLAALAVTGAQEGGVFPGDGLSPVIGQIEGHLFGDMDFTVSGVRIRCTTEAEGFYIDKIAYVLEEGEEDNYYRQEFSLEILD